MKIKNPIMRILWKFIVVVLLGLWVILPDFIPILLDDIVAFIGMLYVAKSSFKDFEGVLR